MLPAMPEKSTATPIPVQLSASEFKQFILPHLSLPKHGPKCKLGYHRVFNLIVWVLYTEMPWQCLPGHCQVNGQSGKPEWLSGAFGAVRGHFRCPSGTSAPQQRTK
jgi:hypothetical protein